MINFHPDNVVPLNQKVKIGSSSHLHESAHQRWAIISCVFTILVTPLPCYKLLFIVPRLLFLSLWPCAALLEVHCGLTYITWPHLLCVLGLSVLTRPVTRGNCSWEIKALSCDNGRLQRWRDACQDKQEGQDRLKRYREERKTIRVVVEKEDQKHSSITLEEAQRFSSWSQSGKQQSATDKCYLWVVSHYLPPSYC